MKERFIIFWNQLENGANKEIVKGLVVTAKIAVFGLLIGILIGTLIAVVRVVPKYKILPRILDKICTVYVGFFRGTPMLVQLLLGYYVVIPLMKINIEGVKVAILIFGLNSGAYVSEIMRGGINSVDIGQLEAGRALGLSFATSMYKIVIPQAIKNILPTMGNEFITLIKDTSIVSYIAVADLYKAFYSIGYATYDFIIPYLALAVVYLIIIALITILVRFIERRFARSDRK